MNLELTEREARLLRSQLVRHIVELEDELSRANQNGLERALASEIGSLRSMYGRLTTMLEVESPPPFRAAKVAR